MKHIIWLTPGFAANEADSKCIPPLQLLARQLQQEAGIQLHIIALHYPYYQQVYTWHGLKVYPAYCTGPFSKIRIWWRAWRYVHKLLKKHPSAILHSFWLNDSALLGHWISSLYKTKHWVTLMGQDARPSNKYLRFFPLQKLKLITLSNFHDEQLFQTTGRRGDIIITWGIDDLFWQMSTNDTNPERPIDVLGVGNLIALKDYSTFLNIIAELKKTHPNIKATLIGDGVQRQELERAAVQLGLAAHLTFTGYLDRAEVLKYMKSSRVFLHTSTYESFGYVFLEALACGMRVISRPVGVAQANDRWIVVEKNQLSEATNNALSAPLIHTSSVPYTMEQCMESYLALWRHYPDS